MNGSRRHRTLALCATVAFLLAFAGGLVYNGLAHAGEGEPIIPCTSGECNCKLPCPPLGMNFCYGYNGEPNPSRCPAVCIPDPSQLCDVP